MRNNCKTNLYYAQKGSALIVAVMIITIILIIVSGLYTVVNANIDSTFNNINRTKHYYSAEAGLTYGISWLKNIAIDDFSIEHNSSLVDEEIILNDITTTVNVAFDIAENCWIITSSTPHCELQVDNVSFDNPLKYGHYAGKFKPGTMASFGINQQFIGKSYFASNISYKFDFNKKKSTAFFDEVSCSYSDYESNYNYDGIKKTSLSEIWGPNPLLTPYLSGLYSGSKIKSSDFDNAEEFIDFLEEKTFKKSYNVVEPQNMDLFSETWESIIGEEGSYNSENDVKVFDSSLFSTTDPAKSDICEVEFTVDGNVRMRYPDAPIGEYFYKCSQSDYKNKIFAFPKECQRVDVKGEVDYGHNVTVVTEDAHIFVTGDLYSDNLKAFIDDDNTLYNNYDPEDKNHRINKIIANTGGQALIGLIAGVDCITDPETNPANANFFSSGIFRPTGNGKSIYMANTHDNFDLVGNNKNVTLITAGMFAPNGECKSIKPDRKNVFAIPNQKRINSWLEDIEECMMVDPPDMEEISKLKIKIENEKAKADAFDTLEEMMDHYNENRIEFAEIDKELFDLKIAGMKQIIANDPPLTTAKVILLNDKIYTNVVKANGYTKPTNFILYGGFIGASEGYTVPFGGYHALVYASNKEFLAGKRAPGFKIITEVDGANNNNIINKFQDALDWSIAWK